MFLVSRPLVFSLTFHWGVSAARIRFEHKYRGIVGLLTTDLVFVIIYGYILIKSGIYLLVEFCKLS